MICFSFSSEVPREILELAPVEAVAKVILVSATKSAKWIELGVGTKLGKRGIRGGHGDRWGGTTTTRGDMSPTERPHVVVSRYIVVNGDFSHPPICPLSQRS